MHIRQKNPKIHCNPRRDALLGFTSSKKIASALKKTNILVTFSHYTIICFEQFAPYTVIRHYTIIKFDRFATLYFYLALKSKVIVYNMAKVFTFLSVRKCMVIDNNWLNIFLVLRFVINNHTERFVGIVCYIKRIAILGTMSFLNPATLGEKTQRSSANIIWFIMVPA